MLFAERVIRKIDRIENPVFTYSYSQPDEYRFCQDSVILPRFIADQISGREISPSFRVLDVCAGCGVIGFELAFHEKRIEQIDFLEIQPEFEPYFRRNLEITGRQPGQGFQWLHGDFNQLGNSPSESKYDLIIGNPPYFYPGEGKLSPSRLQNRCRFFLDGDFLSLAQGVSRALQPEGEAYLLFKTGAQHGRHALRELQLRLAGTGSADVVADIRGTHVLKIKKPSR